ncbi:MAG: hypothetical protein IPJ40_12005 [Saprospirales bacterium]|nr:hypothetical protein [Saprospirales bacterium]
MEDLSSVLLENIGNLSAAVVQVFGFVCSLVDNSGMLLACQGMLRVSPAIGGIRFAHIYRLDTDQTPEGSKWVSMCGRLRSMG